MTRNDWHFAQISDPQFGMFRPGEDEYEETNLMARAVTRLNALQPVFVLCTGDLIDVPASDRQMDHATDLLNGLNSGIPFVPVPGNHDIGDAPSAADLAWYRRRRGRDWMSFNHRGWHFVGLNSCLMADGAAVPEDVERQWVWLEKDLSQAEAFGLKRTLVFMHHPLFLDRADEDDDYFNLPRSSRDRCLETLKRHRVGTVFCGHLHRCREVSDQGLDVVVTGPVGMPLQDGYSGLRLIRIVEGEVSHRFFALDDVEGQERFLA